jgi:hypothetical protein
MFIALRHVWHFITDSWHAPRRARWLYVAFAAGFVAMAIEGGIKGDPLVVALGVIFALVTGALALFFPRLASHLRPPPREREVE